MKNPSTKLPWFIDYMETTTDGDLCVGNEEVEVCKVWNENKDALEDAEYIVEACNNYPKAIKLLKMFNSLCEATYGKNEFKEWVESSEYQTFLKNI